MTKPTKQAAPKKAATGKVRKPLPKVSGVGFSKTFSKGELKEIRIKREAMRERLHATG